MASNDSGVDSSNDSNDGGVGIPNLRAIFEKQLNEGFVLPEQQNQPSQSQPQQVLERPLKSTFVKDFKNVSSLSYKKNVRAIKSFYQCFTQANERKLRLAASTCNIELVTKLLNEGTNPNNFDEHGRSPLHLASCRGYVDIVEKLLEYNANPNVQDTLGNTPLHLAVISANSRNFNKVTRLLLRHGANSRALDRGGKTPIQLIESKVKLMKSRCKNPTPEEEQILIEMFKLNLMLHLTPPQQQQTDMVELQIDDVLNHVQQLSITKA